MKNQQKLRTNTITPNENISFPIGTILAVDYLYEILDLSTVFGKHKKNGIDISKLITALVSYKLTDNFSIKRAHQWINRDEVLDIFGLESFSERTLYRVLETIGNNRIEIISDIQDRIFSTYDFEHTNINVDWTSIVLHGEKAPLAKYGYSRDHRPDKKQITLGITEVAEPINVPIGITTEKGNVADQTHFKATYDQVKKHLEKDSLVVFDRGANSLTNTQMVLAGNFQYLTGKQLNKSDDKIIKTFWNKPIELVSSKDQIYCFKIQKPSGFNFLYFSPKLQKEKLASKERKIRRQIDEAQQIQSSIDKNKKLPKKFRINNVLIDVEYSLQTKLAEIDENEAIKMLQDKLITGREGFFCLRSSKNLTAKDALQIYRKKDSVEKTINSLKNEIEIKPLRVWSDASIYGAIIIGFIAQLFISLMRFEFKELKSTSTKFI
ncbi:IS1634 family transposase, partial [Methanosalsum natronophilum]